MKKLLKILLCCGLGFSITACQEKKSVDESFTDDLESGLIKRWDLVGNTSNDTASTQEDWEGFVNAELDKIGDYKDKEFENKELKEQAITYIKSLEDTKDALKYYESNYSKFSTDYYGNYYNMRLVALKKINEITPLEFKDDSDKKNFEGMIDEAETREFTNKLVDETEFKKTKDEYGYKTYSVTIENTSNANFEYLVFDINLVDKDGVVVETQTASTNNWEKGTKHRFEFGTDKKFKKIEISKVEWNV